MVSVNVFMRLWRKLKAKIQRIRQEVKNNEKIKGYVDERNQEEHEELSILQEEMGEFGKLRIFSGEQILPEERKPPVTSKRGKVTLSQFEQEVLSKHPKYAVRAMISKEKWMIEFEKGMCKKLNWYTIFKDKDMNFGRQKATEMKNNKRIKLPKSSSTQVEALIEDRRKRAVQLYDVCIKKLGEGAEKGKDNLTLGENRGLKSLKKRVDEGEITICQTDKSCRFCVLTREQYMEAGMEHVKND